MRMFLLLLLLFPFIELAVLIKVGSAIGVLATLMLIVLSGILGMMVLRIAGVTTAWRARERMAKGEMPDQEIFSGMMLTIAGGLLIFPGLVSDAIALLLLLPITRQLITRNLHKRIQAQMAQQRAYSAGQTYDQANDKPQRPNVLEGEFERRD